jgi:malonyl-CoA/methylmalonyl-CoA synthetase
MPPAATPPDDLLAEGSLPRAWAARWAAEPDRLVLADATGGWWTAGDLERASREAATSLWHRGLRPGARVLISAGTSLSLVAAHVGAMRLGAVVVPANTGYQAAELAHLVADAQPRLAVVDDDRRAGWITDADPAIEVLPVALPSPLGTPRGDVPPLDQARPDEPGLILYTSGTTGRPKGATLTHGNLLASAEAVRRAWRWEASDRLVLALPLFHAHGLCVGVHGTLLAGASAVLLERFEAEAVLASIDEHRATQFFGVPTMYSRLAASPRAGALASLRLCVSGSAPLPPELFDRIEEVSGQRVLERYGMSETLMLTSNPYEGERRPGTVGLPLPGVEVRLAEGATGEVEVRGPNVFAGYWGNEAATDEAFDEGWFRTGDVGELDDRGYLRLVGRAKELIITGGYNVYPREVEEALDGVPGVRELAVAGEPSEEWGETVTAYLVLEGDGDGGDVVGDAEAAIAALSARAAERLAAYKRPRRYHLVGALPRNALGKVVRAQLRHVVSGR